MRPLKWGHTQIGGGLQWKSMSSSIRASPPSSTPPRANRHSLLKRSNRLFCGSYTHHRLAASQTSICCRSQQTTDVDHTGGVLHCLPVRITTFLTADGRFPELEQRHAARQPSRSSRRTRIPTPPDHGRHLADRLTDTEYRRQGSPTDRPMSRPCRF